jgi:hypothetical protein
MVPFGDRREMFEKAPSIPGGRTEGRGAKMIYWLDPITVSGVTGDAFLLSFAGTSPLVVKGVDAAGDDMRRREM